MSFVDIVFDGPPGPVSGRFVEAEGPDGRSVQVGEWIDRKNGRWALRIRLDAPVNQLTWAARLDQSTPPRPLCCSCRGRGFDLVRRFPRTCTTCHGTGTLEPR